MTAAAPTRVPLPPEIDRWGRPRRRLPRSVVLVLLLALLVAAALGGWRVAEAAWAPDFGPGCAEGRNRVTSNGAQAGIPYLFGQGVSHAEGRWPVQIIAVRPAGVSPRLDVRLYGLRPDDRPRPWDGVDADEIPLSLDELGSAAGDPTRYWSRFLTHPADAPRRPGHEPGRSQHQWLVQLSADAPGDYRMGQLLVDWRSGPFRGTAAVCQSAGLRVVPGAVEDPDGLAVENERP